jgi:hypothetical protein
MYAPQTDLPIETVEKETIPTIQFGRDDVLAGNQAMLTTASSIFSLKMLRAKPCACKPRFGVLTQSISR